MKTKQLFFCSLTGLALLAASCSSNDEALNGGDGTTSEGKTYAQIAISVANSATTRAVAGNTGDEAYGDDAEYTVNDLTVVLANENDIAMQVITPKLKKVSNIDEADKLVRVTEPFTCTPGTYKVYVLANYRNSQNALTPIIKGSTDMKAEFGITNIAKLSTTDNFFMTNVSAPEKKVIKKDAADKEVDDAGKEMTDGKTNLNLLPVDVERAVSKVTFNNTDNQSFYIEVGGNTIATATLEGASLINLNKKMFLVKDKTLATNKPVTTNDWPYPKDPNYDQTSIDKDYCEANFEQRSAIDFFAPSNATFYCPENTMEASAQLNGQTTGVVYKVKYVPEGAYYTELAAENGTDSYSQMFEKVLALTDKDVAITNTIFTTAEGTDGTDGTFYSYNGYVFKTKAGACLYKAIATNKDDKAETVNTDFTKSMSENDKDIQTYKNGYCYYTAWIKHNPTSKIYLEQDKYGVVRNFWYELTVNNIKKLGYSKPTYKDPTDPDDKAEASIQVQVKIKKWRLVKQNVNLE